VLNEQFLGIHALISLILKAAAPISLYTLLATAGRAAVKALTAL